MFFRGRVELAVPLSLMVAACGGGGSQISSVPPPSAATPGSAILPAVMPAPSTSPSSENFETDEYKLSNTVVASNAIGAYRAGATGKGVTIGFVDTGLVPTLSDFSGPGKIVPGSRDFVGNRPMGDSWGHGTAIAGIAAAAKNDSGIHGIAFDATIFMAKADVGCPEKCLFDEDAVVRGIETARTAGAKVINLSMGGEASSKIVEAARRAAEAGVIIVIGAGNGSSIPSELSRAIVSAAPGRTIMVGAVGGAPNDTSPINYDIMVQNTALAGNYQDHFLAAPGLYNAATYFREEGHDRLTGSSFAAPVVAGAIALIAQAYPTLTPEQMVQLLMITANDLGASGVDAVFGHGLLNIGRAFEPVGTLRSVSANQNLALNKSVTAPAAAGDAVRRHNLNTVVLDDFDRAFSYNLAQQMSARVEAGPLASLIRGDERSTGLSQGGLELAFTVSEVGASRLLARDFREEQAAPSRLIAASALVRLSRRAVLGVAQGSGLATLNSQLASETGTLSLSQDPFMQQGAIGIEKRSMSFAQDVGRATLIIGGEKGTTPADRAGGKRGSYAAIGVFASYQGQTHTVRAGVTQLRERETLLGSNFLEAFNGGAARTTFFDVRASRRMGRAWSLTGFLRGQITQTSSGRLTGTAFSLEAAREDLLSTGDRFMLNLSQPLRIERGSLGADMPLSWDYHTKAAEIGHISMPLTPSGREVRLETAYFRALDKGSTMVNLFVRRNPGHVQGARADLGVSFRGRLDF